MFSRLKFLSLVVAALFLSVFFFARAENPFASIAFPIPELGNCGSLDACKIYCDDLSHIDACVVYGKAHGLIKSEDAQKIKHFPKTGPGGCTSENECKSYCADELHLDECVAFAKKNNLISGEEASRSRQFATRDGPGGCKRQEECKNYCNDPSHVDECVSFAEKNGLISSKDAERVRALAQKIGPGGCKSEDECKQYCNDSAHAEECIAFGEENGFISHEDAAVSKKMIHKVGPGGCQGEQCREYCSDPTHQEECLKFAEENGLIKHDEAERAKKFMDASREGGPGGCQGEVCKAYCSDLAHHDECFRFAKDHDLITQEDEQSFEAGQKINDAVKENGGPGGCKDDSSCRQYCSDPAHVEECLAFATAHGGVSREQAEKMLKDFIRGAQGQQRPEIPGEFEDFGEGQFDAHGDFQKFEQEHLDQFRQLEDLEKKFRGPGGFSGGKEQGGFDERSAQGLQTNNVTGPGGCQGPQECITYCSDPSHRDECAKFFVEHKMAPPPGALFKQVPLGSESGYHNPQLPPNFVGLGGCKSYEECKAYCSDPNHQSECQTSEPVGTVRVKLEPSAGSANPYPCNSYDSCKAYCVDASHQQEGVCLKILRVQPPDSALPSGSTALPPTGPAAYPCNSYDSCKAYCSDASHQQEDACVKFLQLPPQSRSEYFWGGFASLGKAAFDLFR